MAGMLLDPRMLREHWDGHREDVVASQGCKQVEKTESQKPEISRINPFCTEKNVGNLKTERGKRLCGSGKKEVERQRKYLTLFWFPGRLTALSGVEFYPCLFILFSFKNLLFNKYATGEFCSLQPFDACLRYSHKEVLIFNRSSGNNSFFYILSCISIWDINNIPY